MAKENEKGLIRKEVYLSKTAISALQGQADGEKRSLKAHMEAILERKSQAK